MRRVRIATLSAFPLDVLCVMRRAYGDIRVRAGMGYSVRTDWQRAWLDHSPGSHETPARGYDTIVYFANGAVALIEDGVVDEALAELGLREVVAT